MSLYTVTVNWTNAQVYKLIEMFQEREILWNTSLEEYKDRVKKHDAWCEIANALNVDKQAVEKKMRSLVGQFQRELKKPLLGSGADEGVKWFAFKKLMFLKDRSTRSGNNSDAIYEKNETVIFEVPEEIDQEDTCHNSQNQTISEQSNYPSPLQSPQPSLRHPLKRRSIFKPPFEEKRRHRETGSAFSQTKSQFSSTAELSSYSLDDSQAYANFLASKLRQYSRQTRNALQHEISLLLFQADNGHFQTTAYGGYSSRRNTDPLSTRSPSMEDANDYASLKEYEVGNAADRELNSHVKLEAFNDSD